MPYEILVHECVVSDEASKKMVPVVDLQGYSSPSLCVLPPLRPTETRCVAA